MSLPTELIHACFTYVIDNVEASDEAARQKLVNKTLKSLSTVCRAWRHAAWPMILDRSIVIAGEPFQMSMLLVPLTARNVKYLGLDDDMFHAYSQVVGLLDCVKLCPNLQDLWLCMSRQEPCPLFKGATATIDPVHLPERLTRIRIDAEFAQPLSNITSVLRFFIRTEILELNLTDPGASFTDDLLAKQDEDGESRSISLPKLKRLALSAADADVPFTVLSSLFSASTLSQIKDITIDNSILLYEEAVEEAVSFNLETVTVTRAGPEIEDFWREFVSMYRKIKHVDLVGAGLRANVFLSEVLSRRCPRSIETIRFAAEPGEIFDVELPINAEALSPNLRSIEMVHTVEQNHVFDEQQFLEMAQPVIDELKRHDITLSMTIVRRGGLPPPPQQQQQQHHQGAPEQQAIEQEAAVVGEPEPQAQEQQPQHQQAQDEQGEAGAVQFALQEA